MMCFGQDEDGIKHFSFIMDLIGGFSQGNQTCGKSFLFYLQINEIRPLISVFNNNNKTKL